MIIDAFLQIIVAIIGTLLNVLPTSAGLPASATNAISSLFDFLYSFDFLFPVDTIITILSFVLSFHIALFAFKGINWLLKKFPGVN